MQPACPVAANQHEGVVLFGLEFGTPASIEYDPISQRLTSCTIEVERLRGNKWESRKIDCLADLDELAFDDKPIASLVSTLVAQWLEGVDGMDWIVSLSLTPGERREMAQEHAYDLAREAA